MTVAAHLPPGFDWKRPDYKAVARLRSDKLVRTRAAAATDPSVWTTLKDFYRQNPVEFLSDWAVTYDPRNADVGLPTVFPMVLFERQEEFVRWVVERWRGRENGIAEKSRDMGCSWLCCGIAIWFFLFHDGSKVGFGSRKEELVDDSKDMDALFPKMRMLLRFLPKELQPVGYDERRHSSHMALVNPENGAGISGEAGDNIGRGGRATIYFVDEHAHIPRAGLVDTALSQTTNCQIDISTPAGMDNQFAVKRHSGKTPVFTFHWKQHPAKDEAWYRAQVAKSDDPTRTAQELDIDYSASRSDVYIEADLVQRALDVDPMSIEPKGPVMVGLDVARFGGDESVLVTRHGRIVHPPKVWRDRNAPSLVALVIEYVDAMKVRPTQIAVDVIGVGSGVFDLLSDHYLGKIQVVGVNAAERVDDGRNYNRRARMWQGAKEWLQNGPVSLPNDRKLQLQLSTPGHYYKSGLRLIESKDDLRARGVASPDRADALVLTFDTPASDAELDLSFLDEGSAMAA